MTRSEITMRLLSAEARIAQPHPHGNMNDDDWAKLARKMGEVSSAPMFIDDSPNMTMMEIRSKARRQAAPRPEADGDRLPAADDVGQEGRVPPARGLGVLRQIKLLAKGLGSRSSRSPSSTVDPSSAATNGRMMADLRVGQHRAGRRHGRPAPPRRRLREGVDPPRRGRPDRGQAPQRPDRDITRRLPGHYSGGSSTWPTERPSDC